MNFTHWDNTISDREKQLKNEISWYHLKLNQSLKEVCLSEDKRLLVINKTQKNTREMNLKFQILLHFYTKQDFERIILKRNIPKCVTLLTFDKWYLDDVIIIL